MSPSNRRVVLTGIGALTSIGMDAASYWDGLIREQSGIKPITAFDASTVPTRFAGEILGFDIKKYLLGREERKQIRVMSRPIQLAVAAANLAMADAKVDKEKLDPTRFGLEFGGGLIPSELDDLSRASYRSTDGNAHAVDLKIWGGEGKDQIFPLWMLKYLPNMLPCHVSILHNAQGPNNTITEGDVATLLALGEAVRNIERNHADFFLVGGADSKLAPLSLVRQTIFRQMSTSNEAPAKAVKPYDLHRDGLAIGEGAGVLATEELEHAKKRGATIYAEIAGFAAAFDCGMTGKGLARAIRLALARAKISPADVDHVNGHAFGSVSLDAFESRAIYEVFGDAVPVWTVTPNIGCLFAGSGVPEMIASILAMRHGTLPPTLNCSDKDPACPAPVLTTARPIAKPYFVKVSFTDLGQCAAVVCKKWAS
jgi:3-oxoacyl-[acyl-carrier-protein] synthase II